MTPLKSHLLLFGVLAFVVGLGYFDRWFPKVVHAIMRAITIGCKVSW